LQNYLMQYGNSGVEYRVETEFSAERKIFLPKVIRKIHEVENVYKFNYDFLLNKDYKIMGSVNDLLTEVLQEGAYFKCGDKVKVIDNFQEAVSWLMHEAKRGQQMQRYKGLGEMNPEQLWETTMDPTARYMTVVKIEDAVAADAMFTTLMGDDVESRREFIENNALLAVNIDV